MQPVSQNLCHTGITPRFSVSLTELTSRTANLLLEEAKRSVSSETLMWASDSRMTSKFNLMADKVIITQTDE